MASRYHFRITSPSDHFRLRILQTDDDGPLLAASFAASRRCLLARSAPACQL
jgi:DUF1365 family protein